MGEVNVKSGVLSIIKRINDSYTKRSTTIQTSKPILVAVSKTKPIEMIIDAYSVGQRHFGENYVKEIIEKGSHPEITSKCPEIKWHFIGHLQNNKINKMIKIPGLFMIETIDNEKLANNLNSALAKMETNKQPLRVLIQINTSGEQEKNGVSPENAPSLYQHIRDNLKNLKLEGIMTIGKFGHDYSIGPNPDFISLMKCQNNICQLFNLNPNEVNVSMGMSEDFEQAIESGSTVVRVGSSIFGQRSLKSV